MTRRNMDKWLVPGSAQNRETNELSDDATSRLTLWPSTVPARPSPSFAAGPQNLPHGQNPSNASAQVWPAMNPAAEFQQVIPPGSALISQSPAPNLVYYPAGSSLPGLQGPPRPSSWLGQAQPSWHQRTMEFPRPQSDSWPMPQQAILEYGTYQQLWIAECEENAWMMDAIKCLIKAVIEDRNRMSNLEARISALEAKVEEPQQASSSNRLFERGHGEGPSTSLVLGPPLEANSTRDRATDQQNLLPSLSQLGAGTNTASSSAAHATARNSNSGRPGSGAYEESRRNVPSLGSQGLDNRSDGVGASENRAPSWTLDAVVRSAVGLDNEMVEDENLGTEENDGRNDAAQ